MKDPRPRFVCPRLLVALVAVVLTCLPLSCSDSRSANLAPVVTAPATAPAPAVVAPALRPKAHKRAEVPSQAAPLAEPAALGPEAAENLSVPVPVPAPPAEESAAAVVVVEAPQVSPASGVYQNGIEVTLASATAGATLRYTLDGSDPGAEQGKDYTAPFAVSASTLVKAVAFLPGSPASPVVTFDYTIGEVCVAGDAPAGGDGTRTRPLNRLAAAVDAAQRLGIPLVKLGPGPVVESLNLTVPLSYSGGWTADFSWRSGSRTIVEGVPAPGLDKRSAAFGWRIAGKSLDHAGFEGLEIRGGAAPFSAGLILTDGAAPTFTDCAFVGGPGQHAYGVLEDKGCSATFVSCVLSGGQGASGYGLSVDASQALLQASAATAGNATVSGAGVVVTAGSVHVISSVLSGGRGNTGYGLVLYNSRGTVVEASTLWGGEGREATALFASVSDPVVVSSILGARGRQLSYGIHRNYGTRAPARLQALAFVGCATALYHDLGTRRNYTVVRSDGTFLTGSGVVLPRLTAPGSFQENLSLGALPWLQTSADASRRVAEGGLPAGVDVPDAGGRPRGKLWSIGAWQLPPVGE